MLKYYEYKYNLIKKMNDYKGFFLDMNELNIYSKNNIVANYFPSFPFAFIMDMDILKSNALLDFKTISSMEGKLETQLGIDLTIHSDFLAYIIATFDLTLTFVNMIISFYEAKTMEIKGDYDLNIDVKGLISKANKVKVLGDYELEIYGEMIVALLNNIETLLAFESEIDVSANTLQSKPFEVEAFYSLLIDISLKTQSLLTMPFEIDGKYILDLDVDLILRNVMFLDDITIRNIFKIKEIIVSALQTKVLELSKLEIKSTMTATLKQLITYLLKDYDSKMLKDIDDYTLQELSEGTIG